MDNSLPGPLRHPQPASGRDGAPTPFQEEVQSAPGQNNFYSNYTNVYALIIIDSQAEPEDKMEQSTEYLTAEHILRPRLFSLVDVRLLSSVKAEATEPERRETGGAHT
ncbi:hypothetical protein CesoFtcFv8_003526 [Champsocephalus esox]|uniref:Uncharacterized protein n=1 Tax=Champsocephalus esox TaxID=159716 RepID=A0AAN8CYG2_9TELE|nr:hypothetical protein CesoFtcFv8_003526 [Champsocephalus esox]